MERLLQAGFKYWLNALPDLPKLVRLAVLAVGLAQGITYTTLTPVCSMDFFRSGTFT
ncbi:hypothetical protein QVM48_22290 [Pseudomonas soli]|jgi:hypothetical protein|uniref:hypothetical protein n=1 Tax=Pseudomonas TaxID=286 RepID=UPI001364D4B7|nr:hypothetical protein [Pseudomonas soli]MDT3716288.1 hypothetical protein [Pseudomonas soli]MDT3732016.1 hypothetical protein [Pseudomonas soli]WJO19918.1 hypothetical protein LU688_16650 [Pseudomonas soli]